MNPVTNYCRAILGDNPAAKSAIRIIPELSTCSDELLEMIYTFGKTVDVKAGEPLINEGLFDQWVYFIIKGQLDVFLEGKKLGSISGSLVGERCILGEPRGASLVAGQGGVMALGVEMTIIDELFREINDFQRITQDKAELQKFSQEKMAIGLELLSIVLSEVIVRIINLNQSGVIIYDRLMESKKRLEVEKQSRPDDAADKKNHDPVPANEWSKKDFRDLIQLYFADFSKKVYKAVSEHEKMSGNTKSANIQQWNSVFSLGSNFQIDLKETFDWLRDEFGYSNAELIDTAVTIFEIASQYTSTASQTVSELLSLFDDEADRQTALDSNKKTDTTEKYSEQALTLLRQKLFDPIAEELQKKKDDAGKTTGAKMSQDDINAFFK